MFYFVDYCYCVKIDGFIIKPELDNSGRLKYSRLPVSLAGLSVLGPLWWMFYHLNVFGFLILFQMFKASLYLVISVRNCLFFSFYFSFLISSSQSLTAHQWYCIFSKALFKKTFCVSSFQSVRTALLLIFLSPILGFWKLFSFVSGRFV